MPDVDYKIPNMKICLYCKGISTKSILFDITEYENNLPATQINENSMFHHDSVICDKCHNAILKEFLLYMHNL